jgi:AraC family transcriptional regulator
LGQADFRVWDGRRPQFDRHIVSREQLEIGSLGITSATERIDNLVDWTISEKNHTIVVHLGGELQRFECEFSSGLMGAMSPRVGDIWMIPSGSRYAALAQGDRATFIELSVPPMLLNDVELVAQAAHRDEYLSASSARLAQLIADRSDDLANMAAHAVTDAMKMHMLIRYGRREIVVERRRLSDSERALLAEAIRCQLESRHSLDSLARLVNMDVRRFTSAFQDAFGVTPWQYVKRVRLEEAARMLRETRESVTEIALMTGFATPSHFATAFLKRFGVPPSRWRNNI